MIDRYFTHPPPKLKPDEKHDPQRRRMYRMEREFDGSTIGCKTARITLQGLITHACNKFRVDHPRLVLGRNKISKEMGYCDKDKIWLNTAFYGQNTMTLLHELAHWIVAQEFPDAETHGAEFACVYMQLLNAYRILPEFAFRKFARKWKIKIARLNDPYQDKG